MEDQIASAWRKSSYSGNGGGDCIEVAAAGAVLVRDSKDADGAVLTFGASAWKAFVTSLRQLRKGLK
jgi:hypothetical protein